MPNRYCRSIEPFTSAKLPPSTVASNNQPGCPFTKSMMARAGVEAGRSRRVLEPICWLAPVRSGFNNVAVSETSTSV
jgi:hypothetical protein